MLTFSKVERSYNSLMEKWHAPIYLKNILKVNVTLIETGTNMVV